MTFSPNLFSEESQKLSINSYQSRIHYSPPTGFMNDPNGLIFYKDKYHLFYQFNPSLPKMGNVHWGHAVSSDLLNWCHLPPAILPSVHGQAFSGSAVNDEFNTTGFFDNSLGGIILIYTRAGQSVQSQELAYSIDEGKNFIEYSCNPVLDIKSDQFRDPKVFWYAPEKYWVMVVAESRKHRILFYRSTDLKNWELLSQFADAGLLGIDYECPDLVCVPVEGGGEKWVLFVSINPGSPLGGSTVQYFVGDFDGLKFTPSDAATRLMDFGKDFYAFQSFSGISGQPIGLAWLSNWQYANIIPFFQSRGLMTLPRKIGLRKSEEKWTITQEFIDLSSITEDVLMENPKIKGTGELCIIPIPLEKAIDVSLDFELQAGSLLILRFSNVSGEVLDVGFDGGDFGGFFIDRGRMTGFSHRYFVNRFSQSVRPGVLNSDIRLVLDQTSLEILADKGSVSGTSLYFSTYNFDRLTLLVENANATINNFKVLALRSMTAIENSR